MKKHNRHLSKLGAKRHKQGASERRAGVYRQVHEDSSTEATQLLALALEFQKKSNGWIAGVDEVGRGPLAGPVVVAAVILDPEQPIEGLMDSKALSPKRRYILAETIRLKAKAFAIGRAEVEEIDRYNILQATFLAMQRAVLALPLVPALVQIDGNKAPNLPYPTETIIRGDQLVEAISAASILAKVTRDEEMEHWDRLYPGYGFSQHKGYGTALHLAALARQGPCAIHRASFAPVRQAILRQKEAVL